MSRKQQVFGWFFVLALVGVISVCATNLIRADDPHDQVPVPLPVIAAAPLPVIVLGPVSTLNAPPIWEYKAVNAQPALVYTTIDTLPPHLEAFLAPFGADGWEYVRDFRTDQGFIFLFKRTPR
jgi:hypothetical protein